MSKLFLLLLLLILGTTLTDSNDLKPNEWKSDFSETFKDMQMMAHNVRRDVESMLHKTFHTWDLLDFSLPFDEKNESNAYYRMKIRTDDGGHVKVKTIEKEPGRPEKVHVEEYDRGNKALEQNEQERPSMLSNEEKEKSGQVSEHHEISELAEFKKSFSRMQEIADQIRKGIESRLSRSFSMWDLMDYSLPMDPEKSYVRMKIKTDDHGHVRVKTAEKEPGKEWDVKIEEYNRGDKDMALEQDQTKSIGSMPNQGTESAKDKHQNSEGIKIIDEF